MFPIIGTALLTVALFLLSRLTEHTPGLVMDLYFFVLGASLGLILQVLVIAVQNSADYADLGAATSGATFFRSIGGAFGVAIFGSIFSNRLAAELAAELHGSGCRPVSTRPWPRRNPPCWPSFPSAARRRPAGLHTVHPDCVPRRDPGRGGGLRI